MKRKKQLKKRHMIKNIMMIFFLTMFCMVLGLGTFLGIRGYRMYREAVEIESIESRVEKIHALETFTTYQELAPFYVEAVLSAEDHRFRRHIGIDFIAITRAALADLKARAFVQGGSTITQQVAKNMLFTQEKQFERKIAEVFAALELEKRYTKEEIFELYVNTIYFGSGYYGISEAAEGYFGKIPKELTQYEAVMLAGVVNAPTIYAPDVNQELAQERVEQVLGSMVHHGVIKKEEAEKISAQGIDHLR